MGTSLKTWATPIAIGSFIISAVTGLLIFFDIEIGAIEPVHRWLSWLLLGGIGLHTLSNWKPFAAYFSRKPALAVMGLALVVTGASMLPVFGEEEEEGKRGGMAAVQALESASLATVALVVKAPSGELIARLGSQGIKVDDPARSIAEIARMNGKEGRDVLGVVLGDRGEAGEAH
ncbi:MAG: DUF4405 domain-containing protein [Chlorobiaceae bacterium]|nr:DUF4405 domain-containing protein [Chlorobiaceae bacterium]